MSSKVGIGGTSASGLTTQQVIDWYKKSLEEENARKAQLRALKNALQGKLGKKAKAAAAKSAGKKKKKAKGKNGQGKKGAKKNGGAPKKKKAQSAGNNEYVSWGPAVQAS